MKRTIIITTTILAATIVAVAYSPIAYATDLWGRPVAGGTCIHLLNPGCSLPALFTTSTGGIQAQLRSSGGTYYNLFENSLCNNPVYFM